MLNECGRLNNGPPKDVPGLVPGTCNCVALCGRRDFSDVIELRVLRCRDYPGLSGWTQCNHKGPYKKKAGVPQSEREF